MLHILHQRPRYPAQEIAAHTRPQSCPVPAYCIQALLGKQALEDMGQAMQAQKKLLKGEQRAA